MRKTIIRWIAAATTVWLAGCSVTSVKPGMSREEVIAGYGRPSSVVALASGSRLQYSLQPLGRSAVMVDLDANGKVLGAREVMTFAEFSKIVPGQWTRGDIEREFGPPAMIDRVASWQGDIMTYRWQDVVTDKFFYVYLDPAQVVQRTGQAMEFRNHDNDLDF